MSAPDDQNRSNRRNMPQGEGLDRSVERTTPQTDGQERQQRNQTNENRQTNETTPQGASLEAGQRDENRSERPASPEERSQQQRNEANEPDQQPKDLATKPGIPSENKSPSQKEGSRDDQTEEEKDELASIYTLKAELSDYMGRRESAEYHEVYPGAERAEYDFTMERQHIYSTNFLESTSHLVKGCLGAGIMSIHEGYMHGGLWASLGATAVIGFFMPYTMYMLVVSAQKLYVRLRVPRLTYPDLMEAAVATGPLKSCRRYSKVFRYTIDTCLFIELCGTCCIYEIIIAQTLKQTLEAVSPALKNWNMSIRIYILIVLIPLFFICMIRNLKYLAPFSLIADLFVAICVLTTMYYSISHAVSLSERPAYKSFYGLTQFTGILLYSVDGVAITLPVENNMKNPRDFTSVLQIGWSIVIISVTLTGFFGYLGWGEECRSPITMHMPLETITITLQFMMCAVLTVTFAVSFWVPFRIVWHYIGRKHKRKRDLWERLYRAIHVLLVTGLSVSYPNLIQIMIFLGNFFLAFIAFVFPAVIESLVFWNEPRRMKIRWRFIKNLIIILLGIFLAGCAFYV